MLGPLVKWPGGKSRLAKRVVRILPDHDTYVEPFAGGASIFWNKPKSKTEVLNDASKWLMDFYRSVQRGELASCKPTVRSRENFARLGRCSSACCKLMLNKMSFHGDNKAIEHIAKIGELVGERTVRDIPVYEKRLKNAKLMHGDFEKAMRQHDGPRTLHYLDPPYTEDAKAKEYSKRHYEHGELSFKRVVDVARTMQGKVMISFDANPNSIKVAQKAGFKVYRIMGTTNVLGNGSQPKVEIVACNFEIPKSKLKPSNR